MIFFQGLDAPEGPTFMQDGSLLVVEMGLEKGCITQILNNGKSFNTIARTGGPNGLTVDRYENIWVTETIHPSLVKVSLDGACSIFLTGSNEVNFLFPNDVVVGPDKFLYMTDSGILNKYFSPGGKVVSNYRELQFDGRIFRIDPEEKKATLLDRGLKFPNGLAFGPDGHLYINETITGDIYKYRLENGCIMEKEKFGNVEPIGDNNLIKGPDGMKFDEYGNLFIATLGHGDITVIDTSGSIIERIKARGRLTTNLAFGPKGSKKIYVTEVEFGCVEVFNVGIDGYKLFN